MKNLKPDTIPRQMTQRLKRLLAASIFIQFTVILMALLFLSWRDAIERGKFLSGSNDKSIGLLLATGDLVQLKTLTSSFRSDYVTKVQILDQDGNDILESVVHHGQLSPIERNLLTVSTRHPISYNDQVLGFLILANRIIVQEWLYICAMWLITAVLMLFVLTKKIETFGISIGRSVASVISIFGDETRMPGLQKVDAEAFMETQTLAKNVSQVLDKVIENARVEKEAVVGRLVSQISHDMRAPLSSFEELLTLPSESPLSMVRDSVMLSLSRINSLIDSISRTDLELFVKPESASVNLRSLVDTLKPKAISKGLQLQLRSEFDIYTLNVDLSKFERACLNLISNAIDFAQTHVEICIKVQEASFIFRVIDDGAGVAKEIKDKLFQRGVTFGKGDGTGLGLAYVKQVMQGHGGDIVYRREGDLTIFECSIPNSIMNDEDALRVPNPAISSDSSKTIAICFDSDIMSQDLITELTQIGSQKNKFVNKYVRGQADILVLNNRELLLQIFDDGDDVEVIEYPPDLTAEALKIRVLRRFADFQS